jgi:hypothetical protein
MAITYENVVYDRVIESLYALLGNEFGIPIRFDEHKGNQSFLITLGEDELVNYNSDGQTRIYSIAISYEVVSGGEYNKNHIKQVSKTAERVKRLIQNNTAYSPSDVYKWHDGRIEGITYSRVDDALHAALNFTCTVTEVN